MPGLAMMPADGEALEVVPTPSGHVEIWRSASREGTRVAQRLLSLMPSEAEALATALTMAMQRVQAMQERP